MQQHSVSLGSSQLGGTLLVNVALPPAFILSRGWFSAATLTYGAGETDTDVFTHTAKDFLVWRSNRPRLMMEYGDAESFNHLLPLSIPFCTKALQANSTRLHRVLFNFLEAKPHAVNEVARREAEAAKREKRCPQVVRRAGGRWWLNRYGRSGTISR
jgi:hypothetical protein